MVGGEEGCSGDLWAVIDLVAVGWRGRRRICEVSGGEGPGFVTVVFSAVDVEDGLYGILNSTLLIWPWGLAGFLSCTIPWRGIAHRGRGEETHQYQRHSSACGMPQCSNPPRIHNNALIAEQLKELSPAPNERIFRVCDRAIEDGNLWTEVVVRYYDDETEARERVDLRLWDHVLGPDDEAAAMED
jgi:hypothetical protein